MASILHQSGAIPATDNMSVTDAASDDEKNPPNTCAIAGEPICLI